MLKTLFRAGAALSLALAATPGWAQTAPATAPAPVTTPADPALWVVQDADTTIYLFGTIHILKPGLGWFDSAVKTAFDKSDTLMLEMVQPDMATMQGLVMSKALNPTGPTITEQLPEAKRAAYTAALTDDGIPPAMVDHFKPWFAAVTLSVAPLPKLGYDPNKGVEHELTAAAEAVHKPIAGLETAEQQLGYFDGLSAPLQVQFLVSTIDDLPKMPAELEAMVSDWSRGDPDALGALMNESLRDTPELGRILLTERNARWADWIEKRLAQPGTVFIAVGAGHLAGSDSVQAVLARHGIKAQRVAY